MVVGITLTFTSLLVLLELETKYSNESSNVQQMHFEFLLQFSKKIRQELTPSQMKENEVQQSWAIYQKTFNKWHI